jgi:cytochrome c biogenesis protein CcmG, thiol:disulfide interchange protein DsbE
MKTRSLLTMVFGTAVLVVGAVFYRSLVPPESPGGSLASLSTAAELPIFDRAGKKIDLSKEKGRIVVIHFWATWCPPCVDEIPELSKFWAQYKGRDDIVLYSVSVDKDWKTVEDFNTKHPNELPLYRDPESVTAKRFGTTQFPETYITNRAGRVLYRIQGGVAWSETEVKERIRQLLAS